VEEAASPLFEQRRTADPSEIDELGHVSNIAYVRWIQDVAMAHSASVGFAFEDYKRLGAFFMVRRHEVEYLRPAYEGDKILLRTHVATWKGASSRRDTIILREADGQELVRAKTLWAYVDATTGRPRRLPAEIYAAFRQD
jgi:acyl-CoA thioester hydrolase